jgi:hypothetical protein
MRAKKMFMWMLHDEVVEEYEWINCLLCKCYTDERRKCLCECYTMKYSVEYSMSE